MPTCPCCGHTYQNARKPKAVPPPVDTSQLSDREVYAHYKRIAHVEDVRFFARVYPTPAVLALLSAAETGLNRSETLRQLVRLQAEWRRATNPWTIAPELVQNAA